MDTLQNFLLDLSLICSIGAYTSPTYATYVDTTTEETPSRIPLETLEETIDNYISNYIGKTAPGAAIAVVKDGEIILSKGYGYADLDEDIRAYLSDDFYKKLNLKQTVTTKDIMNHSAGSIFLKIAA